MTKNEKDLLLKDLCVRLPYGVVIQEKCVEYDETFLPNKEGDRLVNIDAHADLLMTNCGSWYYLDEVKPYLIEAFDKSIIEFSNCIKEDYFRKELKQLVEYLCFPFPEKRGHPKAISSTGNSYNLERFITRFELLRRKAELKIKYGNNN